MRAAYKLGSKQATRRKEHAVFENEKEKEKQLKQAK